MSEWKVLQRDRLPAYITWERYLANQQRLLENRSWPEAPGVPRVGAALAAGSARLWGLWPTHACGLSNAKPNLTTSACVANSRARACCGLGAAAVDDLVSQQLLRALEPAALELSLQALQNVHQERERLHHHWQQRLERAVQEAQRAERQYHAVEPENRLVARSLEQRWEESLRTQCALQEEYDRFLHDQPRQLSADERARILALAGDIPMLWHSAQTPASDRKEIVRLSGGTYRCPCTGRQ